MAKAPAEAKEADSEVVEAVDMAIIRVVVVEAMVMATTLVSALQI